MEDIRQQTEAIHLEMNNLTLSLGHHFSTTPAMKNVKDYSPRPKVTPSNTLPDDAHCLHEGD